MEATVLLFAPNCSGFHFVCGFLIMHTLKGIIPYVTSESRVWPSAQLSFHMTLCSNSVITATSPLHLSVSRSFLPLVIVETEAFFNLFTWRRNLHLPGKDKPQTNFHSILLTGPSTASVHSEGPGLMKLTEHCLQRQVFVADSSIFSDKIPENTTKGTTKKYPQIHEEYLDHRCDESEVKLSEEFSSPAFWLDFLMNPGVCYPTPVGTSCSPGWKEEPPSQLSWDVAKECHLPSHHPELRAGFRSFKVILPLLDYVLLLTTNHQHGRQQTSTPFETPNHLPRFLLGWPVVPLHGRPQFLLVFDSSTACGPRAWTEGYPGILRLLQLTKDSRVNLDSISSNSFSTW